MKNLLLIFILLCLVSCSRNEKKVESFLDCEQVAETYKAYSGEDIGCQFHFVLTEYNNQKFIELRAHCADLARPFVINEYCEDICEKLPYDANSECSKYQNGRKDLEILLIEK